MKIWILLVSGFLTPAALLLCAQSTPQFAVVSRVNLAAPSEGWSASVGEPRCDSSGTIYSRPYNAKPNSAIVTRTAPSGTGGAPAALSAAQAGNFRVADFTVDDGGNVYALLNGKNTPLTAILIFNPSGAQTAFIRLTAPASVGSFNGQVIERFASGRFLILGTQWDASRKPPGQRPFGAIFDASGSYAASVPANSLWNESDSPDRDAANVSLLLPQPMGNLVGVLTPDLRLVDLSDSGRLVSTVNVQRPSSAEGLLPVAFMVRGDRGVVQFTDQKPNGLQYGIYDVQTGSLIHEFSPASLPEQGATFGCYNDDGTITLVGGTALYRVGIAN